MWVSGCGWSWAELRWAGDPAVNERTAREALMASLIKMYAALPWRNPRRYTYEHTNLGTYRNKWNVYYIAGTSSISAAHTWHWRTNYIHEGCPLYLAQTWALETMITLRDIRIPNICIALRLAQLYYSANKSEYIYHHNKQINNKFIRTNNFIFRNNIVYYAISTRRGWSRTHTIFPHTTASFVCYRFIVRICMLSPNRLLPCL